MSIITVIKSNLQALGFTNSSNASLIGKISDGLAPVIDSTLTEFDNTKNSILTTINTQRYGKSKYYENAGLAFQYGDNLSVDSDGNFYYENIDTTKQIIKQAAFVELKSGNNVQLFLKIATEDTVGNLIALTNAQLIDFKNYFVNYQIPGLPVSVISGDANILSFSATCTFYSTYNLTNIQNDLAAALNTFKQSFQFNGTFYSGDLESYIKNTVSGIRNFFINNTLIDGNAFAGNTDLENGYFNYVSNILNNITYTSVNA